jgi:hypothetical protein
MSIEVVEPIKTKVTWEADLDDEGYAEFVWFLGELGDYLGTEINKDFEVAYEKLSSGAQRHYDNIAGVREGWGCAL